MGLKEKIKALPASPGVYLMKDAAGEVIYVGKAEHLKKRVSSYFYPRQSHSARIGRMVEQVADIDYLPTATNAEALLYERSLITQHRPRYNVALRDDKSYPLLKLTVGERFPRLVITRRAAGDGACYYGPYTSAKLLKEALAELRRIFPLRTCARFGKRGLCLNYHLGQCLGPCAGKVDGASYASIVEEVKLFLEGKRRELVALLSGKMEEASRERRFEDAARLKRRIEAFTAVRDDKVIYDARGELEELKNIACLPSDPAVIEAFDISDIMGSYAVGSMVVFYRGKPKKSAYKRFRIKEVRGIDDYGMIREVVRRRYERLSREGGPLPGLVLIDGGKGHLQAALSELAALKVTVPVIAIAKEMERLYLEGRDPLLLPRNSKALHLLQRVRDEAHRFAVSYHALLMRKGAVVSELDGIAGIGPKRKRALLARFGSVDKVALASPEELARVRGMDAKSAASVIGYFKKR